MNEIRIGHIEVDSPWGNAGGVIKHPQEVEKMAHAGVGWIEVGSYTLEPRAGNGPNGEVVYHHDAKTGETYNALGMPNKGMDEVEKEIPEMVQIAHGYGKMLIVNVAPVSENPESESLELVQRAYEAGADAVLLNAGCPNVVTEDGGRHEILSHNKLALYGVLRALKPVVEKFKPVFIRVSPHDSQTAIHDMLRAIHVSGTVGALFTPNTFPNHRPLDEEESPILEVPGGIGGKSGPATADQAYEQTQWLTSATLLDVVSSGGITNGYELRRRLGNDREHMAVAGAGTTFYYESGDWEQDTDRLLWEFAQSQP